MEPLLVLSGPSGVGKGYLGKHLSQHYRCERLMATTTRPMRPGEVNWRDSHFISNEEFLSLERSGAMFMCNYFFDAWYGFEYAVSEGIYARGNTPIVEIYTPTIAKFLLDFPNAYTVFLMPSSTELLRERMHEREQDNDSIDYRLQKAEEEMDSFRTGGHEYYQHCYTVTADNFDSIVADLVNNCHLRKRNETL